ncbi:MAG: hypothetical protein AB7F89_22540 [Pirellulaceae bacterium]
MNHRISETWFTRADKQEQARTPARPPDGARQWLEVAKDWARHAEEIVVTHPGASLAAATVLGMVIGWWIKRK